MCSGVLLQFKPGKSGFHRARAGVVGEFGSRRVTRSPRIYHLTRRYGELGVSKPFMRKRQEAMWLLSTEDRRKAVRTVRLSERLDALCPESNDKLSDSDIAVNAYIALTSGMAHWNCSMGHLSCGR